MNNFPIWKREKQLYLEIDDRDATADNLTMSAKSCELFKKRFQSE